MKSNRFFCFLIALITCTTTNSQIEVPFFEGFENDSFYKKIYGEGSMQVSTLTDPLGTGNITVPPGSSYMESYFAKVEDAKMYSWDLSNNHQSVGKSLKLTVHLDDHSFSADAPKSRAEFGYHVANDKIYYYTWKVFIPNDGEFNETLNDGLYHKLMQLKPGSHSGQNVTPVTIGALDLLYPNNPVGDTRQLFFWIDSPNDSKLFADGLITEAEKLQRRQRMRISGFEKGQWNEIIMKIDHSSDETGTIQFWINRFPVVIDSGNDATLHPIIEEPSKIISANVILTNDTNEPVHTFIKLGHYRTSDEFASITNTEVQSMYIDDFRITEEMPPIDNETKLIFQDCGATLTSDKSRISCYALPNTSNYKFRFTNSSGVQYWIDSDNPSIDISDSYNSGYFLPNTVYNVEVRSIGAYSEVCTIRTPYETKLKDDFCGATLVASDSKLSCYPIPNATNYKFRFTNSNGVQKWINSSTPTCDLSDFYGDGYFLPNTVYDVEVRTDGAYGEICTIRTPYKTNLVDEDCNSIVVLGEYIDCYEIPNAQSYKFKFTDDQGMNYWINSSVPSVQITGSYFIVDETYEVLVRADDQPYGIGCDIEIKSVSNTPPNEDKSLLIPVLEEKQGLKIYPNPFTDNITLSSSVEIIDVEIFDLSGKLQVHRTFQENVSHLDLSELENSIYILKVQFSNNEFENFIILKQQ